MRVHDVLHAPAVAVVLCEGRKGVADDAAVGPVSIARELRCCICQAAQRVYVQGRRGVRGEHTVQDDVAVDAVVLQQRVSLIEEGPEDKVAAAFDRIAEDISVASVSIPQ